MSNPLNQTIRIRREAIASKDGDVAESPQETAEFELVSTQMLEQILIEEHAAQEKIRALADAEDDDGWLARDTESNEFNIVKDDELELALQSINNVKPQSVPDGGFERVDASNEETANELCLVSTQHLRKVLQAEPGEVLSEELLEAEPDVGGFNPYDNG